MLAVWTVVMEDCMTWSYALDLDHGLPMEMLCGPWMTLDLTLLNNTHGVTWAAMDLDNAAAAAAGRQSDADDPGIWAGPSCSCIAH